MHISKSAKFVDSEIFRFLMRASEYCFITLVQRCEKLSNCKKFPVPKL